MLCFERYGVCPEWAVPELNLFKWAPGLSAPARGQNTRMEVNPLKKVTINSRSPENRREQRRRVGSDCM